MACTGGLFSLMVFLPLVVILAGRSSGTVYHPRYVNVSCSASQAASYCSGELGAYVFPQEKGWIPWITVADTAEPSICATHCDVHFKTTGWCNSFVVDFTTSECALASMAYEGLSEAESDVPGGSATKIHVALGREYVARSLFVYGTDDKKTPTVVSTNSEEICVHGDGVIPPFPADQYDASGFLDSAVGFFPVHGGTVVLCAGQQLGAASGKCHFYSLEDAAQVDWDSSVSLSKARLGPGYASTSDKFFIIFGQLGDGTIEYFDASTRTVDYLRNINDDPVTYWGTPSTLNSVYPCAATVNENEIIVTGSYWNNVTLKEAYSLNVQTGSWTKLPDMKEKRYLHACGVVKFRGSTVMMVMGGAERWATGLEFFANSVTFEVLDLSTRDDWEIVGSTPHGIGFHRGRLFQSGFDGRISYVGVNERLYQLDEDTGSWDSGTPLVDPDGVGILTSNYEVIDQKYFPSCRKT